MIKPKTFSFRLFFLDLVLTMINNCMKKYFYITILLPLFSYFSICAQVVDYSSLSISSELKENANAVIRNQSTEIIIEDINQMVVRKSKTVTVLNKMGNADARLGESYDNDTKITNLSVLIYNALGEEVNKFKEKDFNDVSAVEGGTLYSDSRVKYLDYTPVSYPYTVVFLSEYKTSTTGFIPWWFPVNGYYVSVENSSYVIKNPNQIPWRKKQFNFEGFNVEEQESKNEISYVLQNQQAYVYERNAIHYRDFLPKVIIALDKFQLKGVEGNYSNWKEFGKWMYEKLLLGRNELDQVTVAKVKSLVEGETDPIQKAKIVYEYMQSKTRYISVQVGIGGWEPIASNRVDQVGYGDCKGLTNYMKALLDAVGVTSYYTVVYADEKRDIDKEFSSIQGNHVILNIPDSSGKDIWLECTSQTIPFGFLGDFTHDRNVLVITPEGGVIKRTTSYKGEDNIQTSNARITLLPTGDVKAVLKRVSKGLRYDDKFNWESESQEDLIKKYKSEIWSYNNNLEVETLALHNNKKEVTFTEKLEISIQNYATLNENEFLFRVNVFNKKSFVPKRYRERKLPLKISEGYKDVDQYSFEMPNGYVLDILPPEKKLITKFGSYNVLFTKVDDTHFNFKKTIEIKEGVYPKEDYKAYRSFRRSIAKYENLRIAIKKKK